MPKFTPISVHELGDYLKEQRHSAQLSLRQLSAVAGISNPYLSQIERGLKRPSAEILQALAKALRISAESLYVRAGILEERIDRDETAPVDVPAAILAEPRLSDRQRGVLLDVYESFVGEAAPNKAPKASRPSEPRPVPSRRSSRPSRPTNIRPAHQTNIGPAHQTDSNPTHPTDTNAAQQTDSHPTQQSNTKEKQS